MSFLFALLSLVPRELKHHFRACPRLTLSPIRTAVPQPGLLLRDPPFRRYSLRAALFPCSHHRMRRKARAFRRRQSIAAIKVRAGCPPGSRRENQAINKAPASRRMPCFVSWEFLLTCGIIPGSGGFPECSAQHRTVRRRAAAKSAAEGAAHRRSKWRCPDQGEMPSVRWQWLCGAGH